MDTTSSAVSNSPFHALYDNQSHCDVTLLACGQRFRVHKLVLAASSSVFESMLYSKEWRENSESEIRLEEEVDAASFQAFLKYLYTGQMNVSADTMFSMVCLADKYDVTKLKEACEDYISDRLEQGPDTAYMITWYKFAMLRDLQKLQEKCLHFMVNNFSLTIYSKDWATLDKHLLIQLLKRDDLVVENEFVLLEALFRWLKHPSRVADMRDNLIEMLSYIRFPMILPRYLTDLEISDVNTEFGDVLSPFIFDAYRFHAVPRAYRKSTHFGHIDSRHFIPRNYIGKDHNICTDIKVENFRTVDKINSRLSGLLQSAVSMSFADSNGAQRMCFNMDFFPKGFYKTERRTNRCSSPKVIAESRQTSLNLRWCNVLGQADVEVSVLVYARKNGVEYAAYAMKERRTLDSDNQAMSIQNIVNLKEVLAENSEYLINGELHAKVILRLLNFQPPDSSAKKRAIDL